MTIHRCEHSVFTHIFQVRDCSSLNTIEKVGIIFFHIVTLGIPFLLYHLVSFCMGSPPVSPKNNTQQDQVKEKDDSVSGHLPKKRGASALSKRKTENVGGQAIKKKEEASSVPKKRSQIRKSKADNHKKGQVLQEKFHSSRSVDPEKIKCYKDILDQAVEEGLVENAWIAYLCFVVGIQQGKVFSKDTDVAQYITAPENLYLTDDVPFLPPSSLLSTIDPNILKRYASSAFIHACAIADSSFAKRCSESREIYLWLELSDVMKIVRCPHGEEFAYQVMMTSLEKEFNHNEYRIELFNRAYQMILQKIKNKECDLVNLRSLACFLLKYKQSVSDKNVEETVAKIQELSLQLYYLNIDQPFYLEWAFFLGLVGSKLAKGKDKNRKLIGDFEDFEFVQLNVPALNKHVDLAVLYRKSYMNALMQLGCLAFQSINDTLAYHYFIKLAEIDGEETAALKYAACCLLAQRRVNGRWEYILKTQYVLNNENYRHLKVDECTLTLNELKDLSTQLHKK